MNQTEAKAVAAAHLATFRQRSYDELTPLIAQPAVTTEIAGPSGVTYRVQIIAVWDGHEGGDVRIKAVVDAGGWSWFAPLSADSFIMDPSGAFVGE
jgi:hypothetical protein